MSIPLEFEALCKVLLIKYDCRDLNLYYSIPCVGRLRNWLGFGLHAYAFLYKVLI